MFLTILLEATYNSIVQGKWDEDVWRKVMALLNESHLSHDEVQSVSKFLDIIRLPTIVIPPFAVVSIFDQIKPQSQKPPENQEENATGPLTPTKPKSNLNPLRGLVDWWQKPQA